MAEAQGFDRDCLEAIKSIGKTLGQMTLYKVGHPAVAATLAVAEQSLGAALTQSAEGQLTFVMDHDKMVANGRIIGTAAQLPSAILALFSRFKLSSLTFRRGLSNAELVALCELAAVRPGAAPPDPKAFLAERGATNIVLNEAVYAKMEEGQTPVPKAAAPETDAFDQVIEDELDRAIGQKSVDATLQVLVEKAVTEPDQRARVLQKVTALLQDDIARRIDEVIKPIKTERNRLQNEQTRTESVLQTMVEGVVMVDEQGKILMMNPAAEEIYGASLAQMAGSHVTTGAGAENVVTLSTEIVTPTERAVSKDVQVAGEGDTRKTVRSAGAVVQNEAGKVVGMVSSLTDAAKHKELQRMQRDFIAHVTHELRAPLSSIRAALEILQGEVEGKIKEDENRMLTAALKNSDRLADLINSILDFSKIESGQMTVFPKKADPERIAKEAVDSLGPWAAKKRVGLSLAAAPHLPPVYSDVQRTVQVIINLISNAIKFTPVGGQITVKVVLARPTGGTDHFILFSVTDTGPGIPKSEQKRIFEKFVQIASGEMHVGGTGLGLAIAKALVHLQAGKLWVESEEGKGATFFFTLPVYTAASETAPPVAAKPAPKRPFWKRLLGLN